MQDKRVHTLGSYILYLIFGMQQPCFYRENDEEKVKKNMYAVSHRYVWIYWPSDPCKSGGNGGIPCAGIGAPGGRHGQSVGIS